MGEFPRAALEECLLESELRGGRARKRPCVGSGCWVGPGGGEGFDETFGAVGHAVSQFLVEAGLGESGERGLAFCDEGGGRGGGECGGGETKAGGDRQKKITPGYGLGVADEEGVAGGGGHGGGEAEGVDEVVRVYAVADAATFVEPSGAVGAEVGGGVGEPTRTRADNDAGAKAHDLDAAVGYLRSHDLRVLGEPTASTSVSEGQRWVYFLSPWGMQFELVSSPNGKRYESSAAIKLWHPAHPEL
jgi:hypothetical protein